jgi:2-oxoglutarate dehydrogenase E1 component
MQVVYPTAAAQIFHLLRRQVRRNFRKPLVVMTPKSLLRTPTGSIEELTQGSFREIIDDAAVKDPKAVKRVILCTGKVYWELAERRDKLARQDVAIVRIEQLYPLHKEMLRGVLGRYPKGAELVWAQEEPRNAGAYLFVDDLLRTGLGIEKLGYIGRETSASPAVGSKTAHKHQQEAILTKAVGALPAGAGKKDAKGSPAAAHA